MTLSGQRGDDAKPYQEHEVRQKIQESKQCKTVHCTSSLSNDLTRMRALLDNVPALLVRAVTATMRPKCMPSYVALWKSGSPCCVKKANPSHHQLSEKTWRRNAWKQPKRKQRGARAIFQRLSHRSTGWERAQGARARHRKTRWAEQWPGTDGE